MFSKPIRIFEHDAMENRVVNNPTSEQTESDQLSSKLRAYYKVNKHLDKCKQADLKEVLRNYKLNVKFRQTDDRMVRCYQVKDLRKIKLLYDFALSGSKQVLADRVVKLYVMENACEKMQKAFRGYIIRESFRLRGPALKNRKICVNETDFYTLEPIVNISANDFFSYKGDKDFIYGFDFDSMSTLFKNKHRAASIVNPYNRESIDYMKITINKLDRLTRLINKTKTAHLTVNKPQVRSQRLTYNMTDLSGNAIGNQTTTLDNIYDPDEMMEKMRTIRNQPTQRRIETLFMEIDNLGNYAQSTWFSQLNRRDLIRFFRSLYDIWYYRAQIPFDVKRKICPLSDPFITILNQPVRYNEISEDNIKELCLIVMEDMVYTGVNNEFRTLGTFHTLCGLTLVSEDARRAMPWLYESIVY